MAIFSILAVLSVPHANILYRFIRFNNRLKNLRKKKIICLSEGGGDAHLGVIRRLDSNSRTRIKSITSPVTVQWNRTNVVNFFLH